MIATKIISKLKRFASRKPLNSSKLSIIGARVDWREGIMQPLSESFRGAGQGSVRCDILPPLLQMEWLKEPYRS